MCMNDHEWMVPIECKVRVWQVVVAGDRMGATTRAEETFRATHITEGTRVEQIVGQYVDGTIVVNGLGAQRVKHDTSVKGQINEW